MRVLQLDTNKYEYSIEYISYLIRAGYIFSTHLVSLGLSSTLMTIPLFFKNKTLDQQAFILKCFSNSEEEHEALDKYLSISKNFKNHKRPTKEIIVAFRKIESGTKSFIESWIALHIENQKENGLHQLHMLDSEHVCNFLFLINSPDEVKSSAKHLYIFDILENKSQFKNANNNIWILPLDFLYKEIVGFAKTELKTKLFYTKKDKLKPYLVKACTLPNFMSYSNQELIVTKKMFSEKYHTFQYHCMEWSKKCYAGGGVDYFTENVYPLLKELQSGFDDDTLVTFKKNTDTDKHSFTLIIGEVSPIHIWKYYRRQLDDFDDKFEEMLQNYKQINAK
jgi:hypothetical protein